MPLPPTVDALLAERERAIEQLLQLLASAAKRARSWLTELEVAITAADAALAAEIERGLTGGSIDAMGDVLGLTDVSRDRFGHAVTEERARLHMRLCALPVLDVDSAVLDMQHQEAQSHAHILRPSVARLERDMEFMALVREGYDPVRGPWWTFSHMRARQRAAAVLERHGAAVGVLDFASLIARHQDERRALETLDEDLATLNKARLAARHVAKERRELTGLLDDVDAHVRSVLRERILAALQARTEQERRVESAQLPFGQSLVIVDGLRAKKRYVQAALAHHVERNGRTLANRRTDTSELRRAPTSFIQQDKLAWETRSLVDDTERELAVFDETLRRIASFDDWALACARPHAIFFDLFVNGTVDGSYIDEVVWQRTSQSAPSSSTKRVHTWTENAAGAAERLAAIWDSVKDAAPSEGPSSSSVPAPITFDDEPSGT